MAYLDEEIAEQLNKDKKGISVNIYDGLYINEKLVTFSEQILFDGTFSIMLPESFKDLDEDTKKLKYQSENRPQIIKTNTEGIITFGMSRTDVTLPSEQLFRTVKTIKQSIKNCQPANIFYEKKNEKTDFIEYGWFDFKGYAIDGQVYYINAFPIVNSKMYHIVFSCPFRDMNTWKPVALKVMQSMKDLTKQRTV